MSKEPRLTEVFFPLIETNRVSEKELKTLYNVFGNFYSRYKDPAKLAQHLLEFNQYCKDHENDLTKLKDHPEGQSAFFDKYPRPNPIPLTDRPQVAKGLGLFTIKYLANQSDFKGIQIVTDLESGGYPARGLFQPTNNTITLNSACVNQDILSTLVHEGNHAFNKYTPYIEALVKDFLIEESFTSSKQTLDKEYIEKLFKGIQVILNHSGFNLYKLTNDQQKQAVIYNKISTSQFNPWADKFQEIPAHALETMMLESHPWIYDKTINIDSYKLLKLLIEKTLELYAEQEKIISSKQQTSQQDNSINYGVEFKDVQQAFEARIEILESHLGVEEKSLVNSYPHHSTQGSQHTVNIESPISPQYQPDTHTPMTGESSNSFIQESPVGYADHLSTKQSSTNAVEKKRNRDQSLDSHIDNNSEESDNYILKKQKTDAASESESGKHLKHVGEAI